VRRFLPLLLASAAFAAIAILWIVTDKRAAERVYDDFSSSNTSDNGLSQAAAYLATRGKTSQLTHTIARRPLEPNAVVFRVTHELERLFEPEELEEKQIGPVKPKERPLLNDEEDAFIRRGGRMIIAAHLGILQSRTPTEKKARKVFPMWPGVDLLEVPEATSSFSMLRPRMHAVFVAGTTAVIARERIGDGDLYIVAWPEIFQNANLAKANHLALLVALAGKRPVYFDEVVHGMMSGDGALDLMKDWNLGPFLVVLVLIAVLVFWRASRRVGPAEDDHREVRSDAIDLVRSLAALYREVTKDREAVALYHDSLTRTVAHTSGLRGDALRKRVDELTGGRRTLDAINEGFMKLQSVKGVR
jgi:hypothetical protein